MSVTITIGWWVAPALLTAAALGVYWRWEAAQPPASGYGSIGQGLGSALMLLLALACSAAVWILYLTLRLWEVIPT